MINAENLFSFVSTLTGVQRFSMLKACHQENVLEHTGMVAVFCLVIADNVDPLGDTIDYGKLLRKAIIHDFDEAITGDVARPTKYFSAEMRHQMGMLERRGITKISQQLGTDLTMHENCKSGAEGYIIKLADVAAMVHKLWEEVIVYGNRHFVGPAQAVRNLLHSLPVPMEFYSSTQEKVFEDFKTQIDHQLWEIIKISDPLAGAPR